MLDLLFSWLSSGSHLSTPNSTHLWGLSHVHLCPGVFLLFHLGADGFILCRGKGWSVPAPRCYLFMSSGRCLLHSRLCTCPGFGCPSGSLALAFLLISQLSPTLPRSGFHPSWKGVLSKGTLESMLSCLKDPNPRASMWPGQQCIHLTSIIEHHLCTRACHSHLE